MRSRLIRLHGVCVLAVAGLAFAAFAASAAPASAARVVTFHDATGEVAGAPDIGKVTITQDEDVLTVEAAVSDLPQLGDEGTALFELNTDGDATTGSLDGADYILLFDLKTWQGAVQRWNGSKYVDAKKSTDPSRTLISGSSVGFMFNLANFGWPKQIQLGVVVVRGAVADGLLDRAPDTGAWPFAVTPTMQTLDLDFTQTRPHVGSVFGYSAGSAKLALSDKTTVAPRTLSCTAHLGGVQLSGLGRKDSCRWMIPAGSAGKLLTVDATARYDGMTDDFGSWKFRVAQP
jgi:hypothetical protein